ncbi:PhzF family phenazine biosynthesis protein [Aquimarina sp. 2201CG5-10]|uniref:PhzF family phenazine biosynthesis protein n=1 Tax=Aquimarina callyspongiae TaxID=3098150 RepID=UPI002AB5C461|nr:PhzF family phenazine biosynthesis protein [Aquimarina sp. 2201CG5-10]MDY8135826.1 PhzF family phenazine biosynthesis protein [Aquimarina sp. 2201CG5-10]
MKIKMYQIDAFTKKLFGGNPAAICHLPHWLNDETLQNIAIENNLAETGYFVKNNDHYEIRWFMPYAEIDLCGHATLASAYVIFNYIDTTLNEVTFSSKSGVLKAKKEDNGSITLDFPSRPPKEVEIPAQVYKAFNSKPIKAYGDRDLIITVSSEKEILSEKPNLEVLRGLPYLCTIITSPGENVDFVSRVFDANPEIPMEDPVTGSAHSSLVPLWAEKLNKNKLKALQLSERRGELDCRLEGDRVYLSGYSVPFLIGEIEI